VKHGRLQKVKKMACFERKVFRRIYGPTLENEEYRRTYVEVQQIYQKPSITT
jgi:oligoendopeptidase F